jgi:acetyltransferase-like isoleucine patch superfamily enzyme
MAISNIEERERINGFKTDFHILGFRSVVKSIAKAGCRLVALAVMFPLAALSGFGRISTVFELFAQMSALVPGLLGDYLRVAYYFMTLRKCPLDSRISFASFFAQSSVTIGRAVYIGAYCVIASCHIGERTQIASHVQIFGGGHQHRRDGNGHILPADARTFETVTIGDDCWVGASAIVMANVGAGTTIGAGAVVTRPIPAHVVAVGNPARVIDRPVP